MRKQNVTENYACFTRKKIALAVISGVSVCSTVNAQQGETNENSSVKGLEVIEVTAQKRVQNLQELPNAVSVFNSQSIREKGISDVQDLSEFTPNVQIAETPGSNTGATIAIRGSVTINPAITWEPTVGVYVDGVFVSKNVGGLFDVAAIDRVEVLRGPQGTLYGKNTIGGALNIITRKPAGELTGEVRLGVGNYNLRDYYVTADSPMIGDKLSLNITANKRERDGFYDNLFIGENALGQNTASEFKKIDSTALRIGALYEHSDTLEVYYTYDNSDKDTTPGMGQLYFPGGDTGRQDTANLDGVLLDSSESSGHSLTVSWLASNNLEVKSITAYRDIDYVDGNDYDGFPIIGFHSIRDVEHSQVSQEFQFIGSYDKLNYVAGLFYLEEDSDVSNPFIIGGEGFSFTANNYYGVNTESMAAFAQGDYSLTDKLTLTAGIRWTKEQKDFYIEHPDPFLGELPYTEASDTWNNVSGTVSVGYAINDDVNTYFKISQGWKSGGFNGEAANIDVAVRPYDAEEVTAYEWGLKSRYFDQRLQTNIAVFYNDITNLQLSEFLGAYSDIQNAGEATISGIELEAVAAISSDLTVNLNYGFLDAKYDEFVTINPFTSVPTDITNEAKFPYTPENTWSLGVNYESEFDLGLVRFSADYSFVDDHFVYHNQPSADLTEVESYSILHARITVESIAGTDFNISVWGKNLLDEEYRMNGIPLGTYSVNYYGDPATYGVELSYNF